MQRKTLAAALLAGAAALGATAAQAQISIGASIAPGVFGQVVIGDGGPPPLFAPTPVVVQPVAAPLDPIYLYVPEQHRRHWRDYCMRYSACNRPVYFVNGRDPRARNYHYYRAGARPVPPPPPPPMVNRGPDPHWRGDRGPDPRWQGAPAQPPQRNVPPPNAPHPGWERGAGNPHRGDWNPQ